ncbi:hypothetical protein [Streptomyces boninensis]|uniref:T4 family baseplate hub assembly chaperone n=1 Tax=Streptomyces boninensis TaxID=2039455 RepID=UPI003B226637
MSGAVADPSWLLAAWEAGLATTGAGRAQLLHRTARPRDGADVLASVPVGEREADLYGLRRALFGERMEVVLDCAACGEALELDLDAGAVASRPGGDPLEVTADGWTVRFRLPTVGDLADAARTGDAGAARRVLIERCVLAAWGPGGDAASGPGVGAASAPGGDVSAVASGLPEPVLRAVADAASAADPAAEVTLSADCPECGHAIRAELDIASYLWTELDAWARDTLLDVHLLATAYGWSEPQILALSPLRRRYYLELCADA